MPNLGIAELRLTFYHANVYATCILVGIGLAQSPQAYNEGKRHALLHALRAAILFADTCHIAIITSAKYPENFLKFRSYVFRLPVLKINALVPQVYNGGDGHMERATQCGKHFSSYSGATRTKKYVSINHKSYQVLNEPFLRQWTSNLSAEIAIDL